MDIMLHQIEMVFNRLKYFHLNVKPKKCHFFLINCCIFSHIKSTDGISANLEKIEKVKDWPVPKSSKELYSFLGLTSYNRYFIPNVAHLAQCLHDLCSLVSTKRKIQRKNSPSKLTNSGMKPQMWPLKWMEEPQAFLMLLSML